MKETLLNVPSLSLDLCPGRCSKVSYPPMDWIMSEPSLPRPKLTTRLLAFWSWYRMTSMPRAHPSKREWDGHVSASLCAIEPRRPP
jgi:hypothetical protein